MCFGIGVCAASGTGVCVCSIDHHFGVNIYHWADRARNKGGIKPAIQWPSVTLKCKQYDILGKAFAIFLYTFSICCGSKESIKEKMNCWKRRISFKDGKITSFRFCSFKWKRSI